MTIVEKIYSAGVVGTGGAGFPTHKKLFKGFKWLIINAAECEPLLQTDICVTKNNIEKIIKTLDLLKADFEIENVVIGIKEKHNHEIELLQKAITGASSSVTLKLLPNVYPMGDEQVLVYEITGETVTPGGIPSSVGAVVQNVSTIVSIGDALDDIPVTSKVITVTGEVAIPCILDIPVGTSIADCLKLAGGTTVDDYICILGGPMMGPSITMDEIDTNFITKASSGVIVLPKEHFLFQFGEISMDTIYKRAQTACIQCSLCTDMCPRFLIGHQMRPHRVMRSVSTRVGTTEIFDALLCCECRICELYACPMGLSPCQVNIGLKKLLRENGAYTIDKNIYENNLKLRPYRQIPQERLISRLQLTKYKRSAELELVTGDISTVSIPLKHGIGKPSDCVVCVGDMVEKGDLIAKVEPADTGCNIHASIKGKVVSITPNITITTV